MSLLEDSSPQQQSKISTMRPKLQNRAQRRSRSSIISTRKLNCLKTLRPDPRLMFRLSYANKLTK